MRSGSRPETRVATIAELARVGEGRFGRTAIMKFCYFLQTLAGVPLHYSFRLYTYGPYDSQVLEDLRIAESIGAVESKPFQWPGGQGVTIARADRSDIVERRAGDEFGKIKVQIEKIAREFGERNASDLELLSTIIYVDRANRALGKSISLSELVSRVHDVKPHHKKEKIESEIQALGKKRLLHSLRLAA